MDDRDNRKLRLQELIKRNKANKRIEIAPLLKECIDVLHPHVEVLSSAESEQLYCELQSKYLFVRWGRVNWGNITDKIRVTSPEDILSNLKARFQAEDYVIYVLWSCSSGNSPVIKTNLRNAIMHIDDINAVCPDQWLYCPSYKFVIEFYHEGDILIGFQS